MRQTFRNEQDYDDDRLERYVWSRPTCQGAVEAAGAPRAHGSQLNR